MASPTSSEELEILPPLEGTVSSKESNDVSTIKDLVHADESLSTFGDGLFHSCLEFGCCGTSCPPASSLGGPVLPEEPDVHLSEYRTLLHPGSKRWNVFPEDPKFEELLRQVEFAIDCGVLPMRISKGSSGSYFVRNEHNRIVGVFKPKDEEPYGKRNPKFMKALQKIFMPCLFGRNCLLPNQGYLSEAGASLVDDFFGFGIVPRTKVVRLSSSSFNNGPLAKKSHAMKRFSKGICRKAVSHAYPPKIDDHEDEIILQVGSFQLFIEGYRESQRWLAHHRPESTPEALQKAFRLEFEKLVCLDTIIRNTDRGNDNWLIRYVGWEPLHMKHYKKCVFYEMKIGAIDNGLSFPKQNPKDWRDYGYSWEHTEWAVTPFSEETINSYLPKLENESLIEDLVFKLRELFSVDEDFKEELFNKQMDYMRHQINNLRFALKYRKTPRDLVSYPPLERKKSHLFKAIL